MKFGVPWSVKGIRPEARESAREAARRSGMSLGEWLNTVILEQADDARAPGHEDEDEDAYADDLAGVHERLDDLTRRISQYSRAAPKPAARRRGRDAREPQPDRLAELIGRLDQRIEHLVAVSSRPPMVQPVPAPPMPVMPVMPAHMAPPLPPAYPAPVAAYAPPTQRPQAFAPQPQHPQPRPMQPPPVPATLDRALAEIAARQRVLNGQPPLPQQQHAPMPQPPAMPQVPVMPQVPTQDLSGLEDQLRRITDQIETLRKPGVEEAINALRDELGDIGRALNEAMPRRAIDTIEKQIQGLTQRIAEGRQAGADQHAVSSLEQGLAEVRDALRGLTPAENLVGFNDAVAGLAHKIDLIVAQKDPATLQQLEHAITTLREMATHVASSDAVSELASQVYSLGEKVDELGRAGGGDALNHLEERIDALSQALAERAQNGSAVPPRLEALVQSLSDKIEQIQQSRGDNAPVGHLEDRIVHLVERLDASDSRLGHLEAIERGLGDLLTQMDEMRSNRQVDALRVQAESAVGVDSLKHDLARTQNALENVNGTLSAVVDRLARIESDIREEGRRRAAEAEPLELTQPVGRVTARVVPEMAPPTVPEHQPSVLDLPLPPQPEPAPVARPVAAPAPEPQPGPAPARRPMPQAKQGPINPDLPPDQPLEPGSGPPRPRAGARIAVSEARPAAPAAAPAAAAGTSSFIAAARRAAQNAVQAGGRPVRPQPQPESTGEGEAPGGLMKRMKSLFVAASIVAIAVGGVEIAGSFMHGRPTQTGAGTKAPDHAVAVNDDAAAMLSPNAALTPLAPAPTPTAPGSILTDPTPLVPINPNPLAAPALSSSPQPSTQAAKSDITGSIPQSITTPAAERLPTEIGGPKLRNAALHGDAAAAYEIGVRFAEGRGVQANPEEAARWYERAASKGIALAQFRYASMLEKGHGVKKDLAEARRLYLAAATRGNAKAMHNLAVLYAEGIDGRPDYATAEQWFRKAAAYGISDSQYNLGVLTARGLGTAKDMAESYKWFALAAEQGDKEAARKRDEVASQMDAASVAAAQRAVKSFVVKPQPHDAVAVAVPPGGWDDAATPAARTKARPGPLSLGAYKVGRR